MVKLHKRHAYTINENQGDDYQVEGNSMEATDDSIQTRAIHNHDVPDHEIVYHAVKKDDVGTSGEATGDKDKYPWFSARVICYWLVERMKRDNTLYWNIDDYDGKTSYEEECMEAPQQFTNDEETRAEATTGCEQS